MKKPTIDSLLFWTLSGLVFLLPILFIPSVFFPILLVKYGLLVVALIIAVAMWVLLRLRDGILHLPLNILYLSGLGVLVVILLSAIFSGAMWHSLVGQIPQTDTFIFFLYVFVLMFMVPSVFNTSRRIFDLYRIFFVSLGILAFFHLTRLIFGSPWLSFGYFTGTVDNMLGKWNDLGIFFGLGAVLSLVSLEFLVLKRNFKILLYTILGACLLLLTVINFPVIWYVLGVLSLVFFVYSVVISRSNPISEAKKTLKVSLPVTSFLVFLISVIFIIGGTNLANPIADHFGITQTEVRTTWRGTFYIASNVISHKSIEQTAFGIGPNRFLNAWYLYKPTSVNNTLFWNSDFNYGVGIVPSALVTTGVLGLLSWIVFLSLLIYMGFRSILSRRIADPFQRYLVTSSFLATLYLWLFLVVYEPSLVIIVLTFFFTGIFIASLDCAGILKPVSFEYFKNPKIAFVSVLAFILILIGGLYLAYTTITKLAGSVYYSRAISEVNNNNIDVGEEYLIKAINFDNNDVYTRSIAQIYLLRLNALLASSTKGASVDALKSQFTNISKTALRAAGVSVALNNSDYQNWLVLGDVYSALVPLKVPQAYENAQDAYKKAFDLNPQNPYIYLELAKLESAQNNADQAKGDIVKALTLKNDYTDAYMLLAQLQVSEGDIKSAIDSVANATVTSPQNPGLFFQLGVLRYNNKDYQGAASALEQAINLNNQYSNARYFLGLSYYQLDRVNDAISQFTEIQKLNSDNQQVESILSNLQNGLSPFNGTSNIAAPGSVSKTVAPAVKPKSKK